MSIIKRFIQISKQRKLLFLRKYFITYLYSNKYGIKCSNSIIKNQNYHVLKIIELDGADLFLDFDFLKDKYTLCGVSLLDSPHYYLMKALYEDDKIHESEYYRRMQNGSLDSRPKEYATESKISYLKSCFNKRQEQFDGKAVDPIVVYMIGDKYYIADGKHRAALAAFRGEKIRCAVISSDCMKDSYYYWNYQKMLKTRDLYQKNIELYNEIIAQ